jgi:hypothetical protein
MRSPEMPFVVLFIFKLFLAMLAFCFGVGHLASTGIFVKSVDLSNGVKLLEGANLTHLNIVAI